MLYLLLWWNIISWGLLHSFIFLAIYFLFRKLIDLFISRDRRFIHRVVVTFFSSVVTIIEYLYIFPLLFPKFAYYRFLPHPRTIPLYLQTASLLSIILVLSGSLLISVVLYVIKNRFAYGPNVSKSLLKGFAIALFPTIILFSYSIGISYTLANRASSFCHLIVDQGLKDSCVSFSAIQPRSTSPDQCKAIKSQEQRQECLYIIAIAKQDISLCENINSNDTLSNTNYTSDRCFNQILGERFPSLTDAYDLYGMEVCKKMGYRASSCYLYFAKKNNDVSLCDQLNKFDNPLCYTFFAEQAKDTIFCEKIDSRYLTDKTQCTMAVAATLNRCTDQKFTLGKNLIINYFWECFSSAVSKHGFQPSDVCDSVKGKVLVEYPQREFVDLQSECWRVTKVKKPAKAGENQLE